MSTQLLLLALIPIAYLLGAIPFGLIVGKANGIDPRTSGSGNIGATNVGRLLGMKFFFVVFFLDLVKGLLPMAAASFALAREEPAAERGAVINLLHLLIAFGAIAGHMFSCFIKFKGGKGVATSAGAAIGLYPFFTWPALVALGIWSVVYGATRYVSLASMIAAIAFPLAFVSIGLAAGWDIVGRQLPLLIFCALVAVMIIVRHRSNIARLRSGTEAQFTGKATPKQ